MIGFGLNIGNRGVFGAGGGAAFDADAQAFFDRVTAAGGTLTTTEKDATNTLVVSMKADGVWSSMKAIYPMVGASAAACAQNLKSSSFTGTFSSGWTFASTGVTPNGTSAYMNTTLIPSVSIASQDSTHLAYYVNQNVKIGAFQLGVRGANNTDLFIGARFNATQSYNAVNMNPASLQPETNNVQGFLTVSRILSTEFKYYKANSLFQTVSQSSSTLANTYPIYIGALNLSGSVLFPDTAQCAFASIGDGLSATQQGNFYTAVQAFQTTLSRQV
jgi:hypothetical protein